MERKSAGISISIKRLTLENFRGFTLLPKLSIGDKVTVIISENGGGKTTLLDAIASALQVFLHQLIKSNFSKLPNIPVKNIKNGTKNGSIELSINGNIAFLDSDENEHNPESNPIESEIDIIPIEHSLQVSINETGTDARIDGFTADDESEFVFGEFFKKQYREGDHLPILVYYGCNSIDTNSELSTSLKMSRFYHLYADCLNPKRFSFDSFLRWFDYLYKSNQHKNPEEISRDFKIIREVVYRIMNDNQEEVFSNLRMQYSLEKDALVLDKRDANGSKTIIEVDQMSSGEKVMFALAADIAKRLILANPDLMNDPDDSPLNGQGIVMIDEIDLHLHLKWQRMILPKLIELFPNVQFVVTTHSPFVVQSVLPKYCIRLNGGVPEYFESEARGDYEEVAIDFFSIENFFDIETTSLLGEFRKMIDQILNYEIKPKNPDFITLIKDLSRRGESVKSVIAFELSQMEKQLKNHGKN